MVTKYQDECVWLDRQKVMAGGVIWTLSEEIFCPSRVGIDGLWKKGTALKYRDKYDTSTESQSSPHNPAGLVRRFWSFDMCNGLNALTRFGGTDSSSQPSIWAESAKNVIQMKRSTESHSTNN